MGCLAELFFAEFKKKQKKFLKGGVGGPYNTIPQKFTLTFIRPRPLTVRQQQAQKKLNPANI